MENVSVSASQYFGDYYMGDKIKPETKTRGWRVAIGWDAGDARFHFWYFIDTDYCEGFLYKNPRHGQKRGDAGYFDTRSLDAEKKCNRALIAEALRIARPMFAPAIAEKLFDQAYDEAEHDNNYRDAMARRAVLARYAPMRADSVNFGSRCLLARDGTIIADCDTRELAALLVYLVNREAERVAEQDRLYGRTK